MCVCVWESESVNHSVMSDSLLSHELQPTRLLCPEISRQDYQSGLPCPPPGDLSGSGTEPKSPVLQADSLPLSHQGSPDINFRLI